MAEQEIIDQHFLPKCYLKGFTNNGGLYSLDVGSYNKNKKTYPRKCTPTQICYEKNFYTIGRGLENYAVNDIKNIYQVEKDFYNYENIYQSILEKIILSQTLDVKEAEDLIHFFLNIKFRNKYFRNVFISERKERVISESISKIKNEVVVNKDYRNKFLGASIDLLLDIADRIETNYLTDSFFEKNAHLSTLIRKENGYNQTVDLITNKLLYCKWVLFKSNGKFIGNDNPGVSLDKNNEIHNTKFSVDYMFIMPLTSSLCLIISDSQIDLDYYENHGTKKYSCVQALPDTINTINKLNLKHLNKLIYSPNKDVLNDFMKDFIDKAS